MIKNSISHYALAGILLLSAIGCAKSTDTSSDIIGNWVHSVDFDGNARSEAVTFTIADKVYLTTGTTDRDRFADLWEYDNSRKYWVQKASFPGVARNSAIAFTVNGKGYVGTGYDGSNYLKDFWEYDPVVDTWTRKADFGGTARYDAVAFAVTDKGYVTCGYDGNYLKDLWQYDPATDSWLQKASIGGSKRSAATAFVLNGKAYVVSGNNNGTALNDLWCYDENSHSWLEKRKLSNVSDDDYDNSYNIARYNAVSFIMDTHAYVTTGENGSFLSDTWEYNDSIDEWTQKSSFEGSVRTGAVAFTTQGLGFLLTGRNGTISYDNMYEFHPAEELDTDD